MTTIVYQGPPRGAARLARELEAEGVTATYDPPMERRSVEHEVAKIAMHVANVGEDSLIGAGALAVVQGVLKKFKSAHPGVEADVEEHP